MSEDLLSRTCTPCRDGVPPLARSEAERYLQQANDFIMAAKTGELSGA